MANAQAAITAKAKATYANRSKGRQSGGKSKRSGSSKPTGQVKRHRYSPEEWAALRSSQRDARVKESARVLAIQVEASDDGWSTMGGHGKSRQVTRNEARDITHAKQTLVAAQREAEQRKRAELKARTTGKPKPDVLPVSAPNKHGWATVAFKPNFTKPQQRGGKSAPVLVLGNRRVTVAPVRARGVSGQVSKSKSAFALLGEESDSFTEFPSLGGKANETVAVEPTKPVKTVRFTVPEPELDEIDQALDDIANEKRARITKKVAAAKAKQAFESKPKPVETKVEKPKPTIGAWGKKSTWVKSSEGKTVPKPEVFVFSDAHIRSNEDDQSGDEFWVCHTEAPNSPATPDYPPEIEGDWGAMAEWDDRHRN